jgi:hypothetical protein
VSSFVTNSQEPHSNGAKERNAFPCVLENSSVSLDAVRRTCCACACANEVRRTPVRTTCMLSGAIAIYESKDAVLCHCRRHIPSSVFSMRSSLSALAADMAPTQDLSRLCPITLCAADCWCELSYQVNESSISGSQPQTQLPRNPRHCSMSALAI